MPNHNKPNWVLPKSLNSWFVCHILSLVLEEIVIPFIPLACAECDDSLPFLGASSIPLCYILFPSTLFHQLVFCPPLLHLVIYFLVCLLALLFPDSYLILFLEFYFLPFSVHAETTIIYLTFLSLL